MCLPPNYFLVLYAFFYEEKIVLFFFFFLFCVPTFLPEGYWKRKDEQRLAVGHSTALSHHFLLQF